MESSYSANCLKRGWSRCYKINKSNVSTLKQGHCAETLRRIVWIKQPMQHKKPFGSPSLCLKGIVLLLPSTLVMILCTPSILLFMFFALRRAAPASPIQLCCWIFFCPFSQTFRTFLKWAEQNWMQHSKCGLTGVFYRLNIISCICTLITQITSFNATSLTYNDVVIRLNWQWRYQSLAFGFGRGLSLSSAF